MFMAAGTAEIFDPQPVICLDLYCGIEKIAAVIAIRPKMPAFFTVRTEKGRRILQGDLLLTLIN